MKFEKVRQECFERDSVKNICRVPYCITKAYEGIVLPTRSTEMSAGYDFRTPYDVTLVPGQRLIIPTGVKAKMEKGEVLLLTVRSSIGIRDGVVFPNSIALIDGDYYQNESNDGDIMLALWNTSNNVVRYEAGTRIAQGMFVKFDITEDDNATGERGGGIGSTGVQ